MSNQNTGDGGGRGSNSKSAVIAVILTSTVNARSWRRLSPSKATASGVARRVISTIHASKSIPTRSPSGSSYRY